MTTSIISFVLSTLQNFQADKSVLAGGAGSVLTVLVGAALVAAGVSIPPLGFLGITAAIPLTMPMFYAAAVPVGHLVTALVPATLNQQLEALATKLNTSAQHLTSVIPQLQDTYPIENSGAFKDLSLIADAGQNTNINKAGS